MKQNMNAPTTSAKALPPSLERSKSVEVVAESSVPQLRRSQRERNIISTKTLRRFQELFWDGDDRYDQKSRTQSVDDDDDDDDSSAEDYVVEDSISLATSKKRPRIEFENDNHCGSRQEENGISSELSSPYEASIVSPSPLDLSQSSWTTNGGDLETQQQPQQQQPKQQQQPAQQHHSQRWWAKRLILQKVFDTPRIYAIDNFLTNTQLTFLHELIQHHERRNNDDGWQRSFCDTDQGTVVIDNQHRTSSFLSIPKQSGKIIREIERTAADLLGVHVQQLEALQLVRYRPGEFFGLHHDLGELVVDEEMEGDQEFDEASAASVLLPPKSIYGIPRRVATLFCYLNTLPPECGGATFFPLCNGLQIQPKAGRAVLFCNITPQGLPEPKTIHAGQPVIMADTVVATTSVCLAGNQTDEAPVDNTLASAEEETGSSDSLRKPKVDQLPEQSAQQQHNDFSGMNVKYGLNIWACEA